MLEVLSGRRRAGVVELLLVLPDGSRVLVPADWTDVVAGPTSSDAALGSLTDLLHAVTVVAALLAAVTAAEEEAGGHPSEEGARGLGQLRPAGVGSIGRRTAGRGGGQAGPLDRQDGHGGARGPGQRAGGRR
jgi:hypothetical protein